MGIIIKSQNELDIMRKAGRIVAVILDILKKKIEPGIITEELDRITVEEMKRHGVTSSFKNYRGFPSHLCVSVNEQLVLGIPGERVLKEGDIVSLDFGAVYEGFHGDAADSGPSGGRPVRQDALDGAHRRGEVHRVGPFRPRDGIQPVGDSVLRGADAGRS